MIVGEDVWSDITLKRARKGTLLSFLFAPVAQSHERKRVRGDASAASQAPHFRLPCFASHVLLAEDHSVDAHIKEKIHSVKMES